MELAGNFKAGVRIGLAPQLVELALLSRVGAVMVQLAGVVARETCCLQCGVGIAAEGKVLFLAVEVVLPEPARAVGPDFKVEAGAVVKPHPGLVGRAAGHFASRVGEHRGTKQKREGGTMFLPRFVPLYLCVSQGPRTS